MPPRFVMRGRNHDDRARRLLLALPARRNMLSHQFGVDGPLDVRNVGAFGRSRKRRSAAECGHASRAANPVDEVLSHLRQIVIDHVRDPFHMNPARRHIRGYQDPVIALLESAQRLVALILRAVAVDGRAVWRLPRTNGMGWACEGAESDKQAGA